MAGLIRQGHFLGAKLRSLRKRNGLTLDELSARCVQIDAEGAPSVSYLSMVETGKRMPSAALLEHAGRHIQQGRALVSRREHRRRSRSAAARKGRPRGHAVGAGVSIFARAAAERVAGAAVADRHDGPPIRAAVDPGLAGDPPQQFSGHRARRGGGRQASDAAHLGRTARPVQKPRPGDSLVRRRRPQAERRAGAVSIRGAGHGAHQ